MEDHAFQKANPQKLKTVLAMYRAQSKGMQVTRGKAQEEQEVGDEGAEE